MNIPQLNPHKIILFTLLALAFALVGCDTQTTAPVNSSNARATPTPVADMPVTNGAEALQKLLAGNQRFGAAQAAYPHQSGARRAEVASKQKPFAIVLSCADSRVPPELVFDQDIGDLFVARVAGNVLDNTILGSIEYAITHFCSPLIVVLGHERCGAVEATIEAMCADQKARGVVDVRCHEGEAAKAATSPCPIPTKPQGEIPSLVAAIRPALEKTKGQPGDALDNGVRANIEYVVENLKKSPIVAEALKANKLKLVGARYDLDTGAVEVIVQ